MFNVNSSQLLPPLPTRTDVVTCIVKVDGQQIPDTVMVLSVRVTKAANRVPFALLHIADGNPAKQHFEVSDTDLFSPGKQIEILAGYHGQNATIFKGIVVRHAMRIPPQGHPALEIECKHLCVKLSAGRSSKFYFNQKDSDIISALLNGKGIQNSVDSSPLQHREMVQAHISDWDFLVARAEANGMLVLANDDAVAVQKPNFGQAAKFPVNWGSSLFEFEAEMDARDQYPTVKASVWSAADQALTVKQPGGGGGVGGFPPPAAVPRNVPTSVSSALSAVPGGAVSTDYTQVMGLSSFDVQHSGHLNPQEAQAWAEAQMTKSQLAKARGRVKFEGVANVAPGDCIELQGVGVRHSGKVYLTGVSHEIERGIWMTDAQFGLPQEWFMSRFPDAQALPAGGLLASVHGLQVGVVTDLANDPLGEDRIQVRLPLVEAQGNGIWMRMSCQDAGQQRGAYWRPEVGDEVICGFINDDPRQGIVLGMMNSSAKPAPLPSSS
ncbi:MAG TPA: phage baseplate assembly protein V, partial [Saprospiraceae bacterium]|nr:phage baseplate assembly protein V [Saprospiraceae bacterium]